MRLAGAEGGQGDVRGPLAACIRGSRQVMTPAPAVVTIRTEGKAKMMPTMFGQDGQEGRDGQDGQDPSDFLRRFFGDQFGGNQRGQNEKRNGNKQ